MTPAFEPWAESIESLEIQKQDLSQSFNEEDFFKTKDNQIFPYYKKDIYKIINVYKPKTFLPFFQALDIPFYEEEWLDMIKKQIEHGKELYFVFGKYLSRMKLCDYRNTTFKNSNKFFTDRYTYNNFVYIPNITFQIGVS